MFETDVAIGLEAGELDDIDFEALTAEAESLVEQFRQGLPSDLEGIPPGPFLAAILSTVDRTRMNGHDLVRVMQSEARMEAHYAAGKLASMVEVSLCPPAGPKDPVRRDRSQLEFADTEIAAALHQTRRSADDQLGLGWQLKKRLPRVWNALYAGRIDLARARVIADGTDHLPEATARTVVDQITKHAPKLTTGQLRARIAKLCIEADPEGAKNRYEQAVEERSFQVRANPDGTANVSGYQLPSDQANRIDQRVNQIAQVLNTGDDSRTLDQIRADVFLDLLQGKQHTETGKRRGMVSLHVDLQTLAGLAERPGEIPGYGPVISDIARQIAAEQADAEWRYTITDPDTSQILHIGTTTRKRPTTAQKRLVQARNRTCVHPGCRMPAINCDIDHTVAVIDGGQTVPCNLAPLCRYHHRAKHEAPWQLKRLPDGSYQWTSPLGHTYTTGADPP